MSLSESQSQFSTETGDRAGEVTYDRKSIVSWLSSVEFGPSTPSEVSQTPPDAQELSCHWGTKGGFMAAQDPKRKQLGHTSISNHSNEVSPRKRQRKESEHDSAIDTNNQIIFMQPPSCIISETLETNPVIALIAATPPFQFHSLEDIEELPTIVSSAVTHMSAIREDPIPNGLKVRCSRLSTLS